jgi:hypothetical protein
MREAIGVVRNVVAFICCSVLLSGDDDVLGVMPNVDDLSEVSSA